VVGNVRRHAIAHGLPPELVEKLWRRLIDWSIAREESVLGPDSLRGDKE
jgi:isochorismate pyruvate lyase